MNRFSLATTALAASIVTVMPAAAQQPKTGVIQMQSAIMGTKEGQKSLSDLEARMAPKRKDLESRQSEMQRLQDQIQKGGAAMPDDAKAQLVRNLDSKKKEYQRFLEDAQAEAQGDQEKLMNGLGQKLLAVVNKYSRDNGYSLVIDVSNPQTPVMFAADSIDITKAVVDLYDKNTATGSLAKPAAPTPAPPAKKN